VEESSMYTNILIRYGELSIKGKNKKEFIQKLYERLLIVFPKESGVHIVVNPVRAFLTLPPALDAHDVLNKLETVFGLTSASLVIRTECSLAAIKDAALRIVEAEMSPGSSLKINSKRVDKRFPHKSMEITQEVAGHIFANNTLGLQADVHHPDKELLVEVRHDFAYVMIDRLPLAGGFPQGSIGKGLLMLSGGIDSPVAGYYAMRKGIELGAIHFASPPYTSVQALEKIKTLVKQLERYQEDIPLYIISFTDIQLAIRKHVQERYQMVIMRRMMYLIAEQIAQQQKYQVLINGESVGQVASQTLESMASVHTVVDLPIIQPVSAAEKNEIINVAKRIGTYETSILPFEDCCTIFVPKSPVTRPKKHLAALEMQKIDVKKLVLDAVNGMEVSHNKNIVKNNAFFL